MLLVSDINPNVGKVKPMLQVIRSALSMTVLGCMILVYSVLLGFGVQAAVVPALGDLETEPMVQETTATAEQSRQVQQVSQPMVRTTRVDRAETERQLVAYLEYRKALETQLAEEFGLSGDLRFRLAQLIVDQSLEWDIDPWLVYSIIKLESRFVVDAVGRAGEIGLMQVLPSTGRMVAERTLGVKDYQTSMLFDPAFNIEVATTHFAYLLQIYDNNVSDALTAYNAGHANVAKRTYAQKVLQFYGEYRQLDLPAGARIAALVPK